MKPRLLSMALLPLVVALSPVVRAADASDASPYDKNPACLERTDSATDNCVIRDEGTPRQTYPPRAPRAGANSAGAAGTPGTSSGSSAAAAGPRDGARNRAASSGK